LTSRVEWLGAVVSLAHSTCGVDLRRRITEGERFGAAKRLEIQGIAESISGSKE